jgi:cell division protein FtsB
MPSSVPKKKKIKSEVLFKLFLLVMTVLLTFNTAKFFIKKIKLDKRIAQLEALIQEENNKYQMYTEELSKVGTPEYYEYLARKYLGYIYPDETVMVYVEE